MRSKRRSSPRRAGKKAPSAKARAAASPADRLKSAVALAQKGKIKQALKATEGILADHPEHWQTLNFTATLLARVGQTDAALAIAQRAITHAPDDSEVRRRLTMDFTAFVSQIARPEAAISVCREYLDRYGPSAEVLATLSAMQINALKMSDGLKTVDEGIARFPDNSTLHHNRSVALFHLGRNEEAVEAFGRVLRPCTGDPGDRSAGVVSQYATMVGNYDDNRLHQLYGRMMSELIVKTVGATGAKRVLDAGCGTGALGASIRATRLIGIDISPEMLAKARAKNLYHELIEGDLAIAMARRTDQFDIIASAVVLYHIADLTPFFREAARLLVPGGHLFFSTDPAPDSMEIGMSGPGEYAHSRRYLRKLAAETGFAEISIKLMPHRGNPGFWCAFRRK